jgi:hypothetical protein
MQREYNDVVIEEFTKHTTKIKIIHPKLKNNDIFEFWNSLNVDEKNLHKRILSSWIVL